MKNLNLGSKAILWVAVVAGLFSGNLPCFASQSFDKGISLYTNGQYQAAVDAFIEAACDEPASFAPHYALGNSYVKLGKGEQAASEYEICLEKFPDAKTKARCKAALRALSGSVPVKATGPSEEAGRIRLDGALTNIGLKRVELNSQATERKKNEITQNAQKYADRIKENAKATVEQLRENSSWYAWSWDKCDRVPILPPGVEQSIMAGADARAEKAVERAQERVKEIKPSGASDVTDGLRSQLYSNSGVRLKPQGTNIYVRNYEATGKSVATSGGSLK